MKILLVCPQENIPRSREIYPSGALLLLGSMLHEKGHTISVIQMISDGVDASGVEEHVRKFKPDIVGITMNTYQTRSAREVSHAVKRVSKQILVVTGGPHSSALKLETLRQFPGIDVVVYGEGEETFLEIVNGKALSSIKGICYDGKINEPRPFINNFDYIPLPNLNLFGATEGLKKYSALYPNGPLPSMFIMASRGCFGHCKFCNTPVFWGSKIRTRKPDAIIREIEWLHTQYGIREIFFLDDTFNANRKWAEAVLNMIIEKGLNKNIVYRLCFRVNAPLITRELLQLAKRANVWLIFYGTENGNQEMLNSMGKKVGIAEIERAFQITHDAGIKTITSFLIGNSGETRDTVFDSIALAKRLKPYGVGFSMAIPFPGTALRKELIETGNLLEENYDLYGAEQCVIRTDSLSREDMLKLQKYATYTMLLQPSNVDYIFAFANLFGLRTKLRIFLDLFGNRLKV